VHIQREGKAAQRRVQRQAGLPTQTLSTVFAQAGSPYRPAWCTWLQEHLKHAALRSRSVATPAPRIEERIASRGMRFPPAPQR